MQISNSMPEDAIGPLAVVAEVAALNTAAKSLLITATKTAREQGHTLREIAEASNVSTTQVWRRVNGDAA